MTEPQRRDGRNNSDAPFSRLCFCGQGACADSSHPLKSTSSNDVDSHANPPSIDVLAIAAHRDDVEQTCGGTLLRMASRGLRTAILDLTQGEAGTRGTAEDRAREAAEAAHILGVELATGPRPARRRGRKYARKSHQDRARAAPAAAARGDSALLAGAPSRPRHRGHARLRCLFSLRPCKGRNRFGPASAFQDRVRQPLRRCAAELYRRHYTLYRAAARRV